MHLVAFVGKETETYGQLSALLKNFDAEKIILVKSPETQGFPQNEKCEVVNVNSEKDLISLKEEIGEKLRKHLK